MKKINSLLLIINKKEKKILYFLIFLMIFAALLETVSIGLVIPAISILINGAETIQDVVFLKPFEIILQGLSDKELAIYLFSSLFIVFLVKTLFLVFLYHTQFKFSSSVLERITKEIFKKIVAQPYSIFFQKNSSKYLNTLSNETRIFIDLCLEPFLLISSEIIIFIFIISLLVIIEPIGSVLVIFTLSIAMLLFYFLTKNKTKYWGKKRQIYEEKLVQNMQETFHGIKEIKIFNVTNFILNIFKKNLFESIEARRKMNFIIQLPRMWLEIVAVFIMILIVLISLFFNNNISNIIPILAVFAAAAFRIIPSANRILIASQNLRYGFASAEKLIENITDIDNIFQKQKKIEDNYVVGEFKNLKMKEVSFNYKNPHKIIFKNMDFTINSGECIGVIGSTGIGKSTFVDIFCGLLKQDDGDLLINNKNVNNKNVNWKNIIGYVPQNYYLLDGTIKENIAFGQDLADINISKLKEATRSAQLDNLIKSLENGYDTKVGERGIKLSGGQRQRLAIARALYFEPQILIFDESTSSLDIETEKNLMETITKFIGVKTMIIISHRPSTLEKCDKIFQIQDYNFKLV